jgi:transposase
MVADELDYVVGVDTHLDEHVLAIVAAPSGAVVARRSIQASARGYAAALRFAAAEAKGARVWAIEGTGSCGAGLARFLAGRRETVLEISRTPRAERRLRGKDDSLDATRTARAALASERLALPRSGERREALRLLLVARRSAVDVRREALGQLRGVIVTAPDRLRDELRGLPVGKLLERCRQLRRSSAMSADELAAGWCCAASPAGSKQPPSKQPSSSASCSATSVHSRRRCWTSRASGRSSPHS